jgi:hypothetical protein
METNAVPYGSVIGRFHCIWTTDGMYPEENLSDLKATQLGEQGETVSDWLHDRRAGA